MMAESKKSRAIPVMRNFQKSGMVALFFYLLHNKAADGNIVHNFKDAHTQLCGFQMKNGSHQTGGYHGSIEP